MKGIKHYIAADLKREHILVKSLIAGAEARLAAEAKLDEVDLKVGLKIDSRR